MPRTAARSVRIASRTAPTGRFGNSGVGFIEGPGTFSWNAGASKRFTLSERFGLRLAGSFTNATNRVNLGDPQLNITNNSFGRITTARSGCDFGGGRTGRCRCAWNSHPAS